MFWRHASRAAKHSRPLLRSSFGSKLTTATTVAGLGGAGLFWYYKDPNAAIHEYVILPMVRLLFDGEDSHKLAIEFLKYPFLNPSESSNWNDVHDPERKLEVTLFQNSKNPKVKPITLRTPVGVAAGLDKNGEGIDSLFNLGFSVVEIGSITPEPQPGNPRPRFFRLEKDRACINAYGFNSQGQAVVANRLKTRLSKNGAYPLANSEAFTNNALNPGKALWVSLGKNKTAEALPDYVKGVQNLGRYADALVINVSSPNTPGLRDLQTSLDSLLTAVVDERNRLPQETLPPVIVKLSPDISDEQAKDMARAIKATGVDGVLVCNSTVERPSSLKSDPEIVKKYGGLSGKPIKPFTMRTLKSMRKYLGDDITIIACGGISDGADAVDYANAGANFVQLYTAYAYKGPAICADIRKDILALLQPGQKWEDLAKGAAQRNNENK